MLKIVTDDAGRDDLASPLDELVAEGARRMLIAGLETEVADYIERHEGSVDEAGRRLDTPNVVHATECQSRRDWRGRP